MLSILLLLLAIDAGLIFAFYKLQRRQAAHHEVVRELTEERTVLLELRAQIRDELLDAQNQVKAMKEQVQVLALEAEQEVRHGLSGITKEVETVISTVSQRLTGPLTVLDDKQRYIAQLAKDVKKERELLSRLVSRSENVAKLLQAGGSWEDIVDEIQARRYEDIRAMLARGQSPDVIANELGVSEHEVRLVSGTI